MDNNHKNAMQQAWMQGVLAYTSSLGGAGTKWLSLADDLHVSPGFRLMDAVPADPRQITSSDFLALLGLGFSALLTVAIPLIIVTLLVVLAHPDDKWTINVACAVLGVAISSGVVISSLEGVAIACRIMTVIAIVGALACALLSHAYRGQSIAYITIALSAGVPVGAVSVWSSGRGRWKLMTILPTIAVVAALVCFLYWLSQKVTSGLPEIVACVITIIVVSAWCWRSQNPSATISEGLRLNAPIPILIFVIAAFVLPGNPPPDTWDYQLWVGMVAGAIIPLSEYAVGGAIGKTSIVATPAIWAIASHPKVAFVHLRPEEWTTIAICGAVGAILGGAIAFVWRPSYLKGQQNN